MIMNAAKTQGHSCAYCLLPFGTIVLRKGVRIVQNAVGDHFFSYTHSGNSDEENLVAACKICNGLKGSMIFDTIEDARRYILGKRTAQNVDLFIEWIPRISSTEDPERWASEYSRFLCGDWDELPSMEEYEDEWNPWSVA